MHFYFHYIDAFILIFSLLLILREREIVHRIILISRTLIEKCQSFNPYVIHHSFFVYILKFSLRNAENVLHTKLKCYVPNLKNFLNKSFSFSNSQKMKSCNNDNLLDYLCLNKTKLKEALLRCQNKLI